MMLIHLTKTKSEPPAQEPEIRRVEMPDGTTRIVFTQKGDRKRAMKAMKALIKATKNIKPDPNNGATAAVRELRDGA